MNFGILANEESWYFRELERAAQIRGHSCTRLDFSRLTASVDAKSASIRNLLADKTSVNVNGFDYVLVRTMPPGSLEQVIFRMDVLARLESAGTRVINSPKALECAVDKF